MLEAGRSLYNLLVKNNYLNTRAYYLTHTRSKMSASTKETLAQADIILNRTNVALARSQRLIASWLPPKDSQSSHEQQNDNEDEDFRGDSEIGGIGSVAQRDDSGMPDGAFKRRKLGANDKLLESLLGKKAANAHRKSQQQQVGRGGAGGGLAQSAPKSLKRERQPVEEDSEDEEGGRAAAFKSRKGKVTRVETPVEDADSDEDAMPGAGAEELAERAVNIKPIPQPPPSAAGKKRPASYLDELLAQKASKKSKKKKKTSAAA